MLIVSVIVMTPVIGFVNLHYSQNRQHGAALRLAQHEIARLAALAERDRIASDLHDLLGHTLSVIVLKAGLASKLMAHDTTRAAAEIADVERISREALGEVRRAVHGFRTTTLSDELIRARGVLETAGIRLDADAAMVPNTGPVRELPPRLEHSAALILRESVTNVIRHSHATSCRISITQSDGQLHLEVADDGRGGDVAEGSGTEGMRARAREVGGVLIREGGRGMVIRLTAPLKHGITEERRTEQPATEARA
jgi:two-component system sensor histidine kinase DesK